MPLELCFLEAFAICSSPIAQVEIIFIRTALERISLGFKPQGNAEETKR